VLDNLNIHKNEAAKQWLLCHARAFIFTSLLRTPPG
jgi:hypothetical protein